MGKDIERYAQMARLNDVDIPTIVHIACTGPVTDFVLRKLDEYKGTDATPSWKELKKLMTKRFAEISHSTHAMAILRRVRQGPSESVQIYSESLLLLKTHIVLRVKKINEVGSLKAVVRCIL